MRNFLLFSTIIFSFSLTAQSWVQMGDAPVGRHHPVTFSLNGKGYSVTGSLSNNAPTDDVYEYDPVADTWTKLADFPGGNRSFAIGTVYDGIAYLGFGTSTTQFLKDLWSFDAATGQWTQLASCPGTARRHPALIASAGKLYLGLGNNNSSDLKDWWEYTIATNTWAQMADLPGSSRHHPFHFSAGGNVYAGMGHGGPVVYKDWYMLDTATNTWDPMIQFPSEARVAGTQFDNGGYGYVLSGDGDNHSFISTGEMWRYNPAMDFWQQFPSHPGVSRWAPGSFVIDDVVYFFGGMNRQINQHPIDVWKFDLAAASMNIEEEMAQSLNVYPNPAKNTIAWMENERISNVNVLNALGQIVGTNTSLASQIDISHLSDGMYFVQFFVDGSVAKTEKVFVAK